MNNSHLSTISLDKFGRPGHIMSVKMIGDRISKSSLHKIKIFKKAHGKGNSKDNINEKEE